MREDRHGQLVYALIGPSRVPVYTFTDHRQAMAEAAKLNSRRGQAQHAELDPIVAVVAE